MKLRPSFTTTLATAVLVAIATLPLRNVFGDWSWLVGVLGAIGVGAAAATVIESLRPRLPTSAVPFIVGLGATMWALLVPLGDVFYAAPTSAAPWRALRDSLFDGWSAMLEAEFPITDPRSAETFAAVLGWIASASAVHVAARRTSAVAGIAASATMLWISTAAALPRGLTPAVFGAGAGAIALFAISTLTRPPGHGWRVGRLTAIIAVIVAAGGTATLLGSASTTVDRDPVDPRSARATETVSVDVPDILAEYEPRREGDLPVLTIGGTDLPLSVRLRLQVYEVHDGERWLPATDFGRRGEPDTPSEYAPEDTFRFDVTVNNLDGPWVPLPDRLIDTDVVNLQWNADTETGITADPVTNYTVTGAVVDRTDLEGLPPATGEVAERSRSAPTDLPDEVSTVATDLVANAPDALTSIDAITARLRELGRDETQPPGSSFGRLRDDLAQNRATGAEQIASLHALMLRAVGIPSRLVVGYVATSPVVVPTDLQIWTEAALPGVGWVPFDPVPAETDVAVEDPDEPPPPTTSAAVGPTRLETRALPRELGPDENPLSGLLDSGLGLEWPSAPVLAGTGVLLGLLVLLGIRLGRRRFRRSPGWPADVRVLGAWAELVDRLRELGAPIGGTTTIDDVVALATTIDDRFGDDTRAVADLASVALHSAEGATTQDGTEAWLLLRAAESRITKVRGRRVAVRRLVDPRVLRYRAPRPPQRDDHDGDDGNVQVVTELIRTS